MIESTVQIGVDLVDIAKPCEVVLALKKMQMRLATGGVRETVRLDGEEVTYARANDVRLTRLIELYEGQCARESGKRRQRFARSIRFI
ncbi:gpW family head-tail joining protein [Pararhizobium haloflavum]|uniref:gpW family head-tail joining protein n=1 Tax=Pararhizobium haloflavum TaxID=2037914 RepID=UPI000C19672B|nr:gpW family head-tail joining protein [Pararhizobium haloflavum]